MITSPTIPMSVEDRKNVVFAESAIPGLNYTPLTPNRNGNTNISFTLPIINRLNNRGNIVTVNQLENLRNQNLPSIVALFKPSPQFRGNPQVLYYWGTHRPPLLYWVKKCDFSHDTRMTTAAGNSAYTMVDIELELDENSSLYRMWRIELMASSLAGGALAVSDMRRERPY